jgi:hypothetical protein
MKTGGTFTVESDRVNVDGGAARFHNLNRLVDGATAEVALMLVRDAGFADGFICHLAGVHDIERDRFQQSSYVVVATA